MQGPNQLARRLALGLGLVGYLASGSVRGGVHAQPTSAPSSAETPATPSPSPSPSPSLPEILGAEAYVHYDRGLAAYDVQRYDEAIAAFQDGYQVSRHPLFVFAVARAQRRAGRCAQAMVALERFIQTEPGVDWTARAQAEIRGCREHLARAAAAVAAFEQARTSHARASARRARHQRWALVTAGAGAAALLVGALAYVGGEAALARAEDAPDDRAYRAELDQAGRWRTGAALGGALGVAALGVASLLWVTAPGAPPPPLRERFLAIGPAGSVGLSLGGRW